MINEPRRRGRRSLLFAGVGIVACALAGAAFAYWQNTDSANPAAAVADSIQTGNTPTLGGINGQDVTISWTATTTASGASVTGYTVNRYSVSSGGTPTAATGGCSGTIAALSCTEQSAPAGTWYYAITPKISLWSGAESGRLSTSVVAASFSVTVSQQVRATANVTGGSIAHFKNNETVAFHLDTAAGTTMSGSVSTVDASGSVSGFTVTVPAGTAQGSHTIVAVGGSGSQATSNTFNVDNTAPSGGSVTYTNGYFTTASVQVSFSNGTDTGGSGINTATTQLRRASATLTNGTCGTFGSFTGAGSAGQASPYTDTSVSSGNCYQYQYVVADNAGNSTTYTSTNVAKVDTSAPVFTITTSGANIYASGMTVLFKNVGSNTFTVTASDPESGITSSSFGTTPTGWTASGSGNARTYTRSTANVSSSIAVSATNGAGSTISPTVTITFDNTAPTVIAVALANGGTAKKIDSGDTVTITYSEQLNATSLCSSWTNSGTQTLNTATVTDASGAGGSLTVSASGCSIGTVVPSAAYVASGSVTFTSSTLTWDPAAKTLTITMGTLSSGTQATNVTAAKPKYTPVNTITDLVGNAMGTAQFSSGTATGF